MTDVVCPYCGESAKLVKGVVIYPHQPEYAAKNFWQCAPCDAYVGCHMPSRWTQFQQDVPLGRLANSPLRRAKMAAHKAFDPLWKNGDLTRVEAYKWLSTQMGTSYEQTHIGLFDEAQCAKVVAIMRYKAPNEGHHG